MLRCESGSIQNSTISFNSAFVDASAHTEASGGGMCVELSAQVAIDHSHFESNLALSRGGAVKVLQTSDVHFCNSTFKSNRAARGGGLYFLTAMDCSVTDAVLTDNVVIYNGGGIAVEESLGLIIERSNFTRCQSTIGYGSSIG
jgi:hypothetical protein